MFVAEVTVSPDASYTSCVMVKVQTRGLSVFSSAGIHVDAGDQVTVAVFQDNNNPGPDILVWAEGYEGDCALRSEESPKSPARFDRRIVPLTLEGEPCATGDVTRACDDKNACTTQDRCLADGGCRGPAPVTCAPPACQWPTGCDPLSGCQFIADAGAPCSDSNLCTGTDRCDGTGACVGPLHTCVTDACATRACNGGPACTQVLHPLRYCGAGACSDAGTCVTFGYTPSNFLPDLVADAGFFPDGGAWALTLNCAATYDTTGAGSWPSPCGGGPQPRGYVFNQDAGPDVMVMPLGSLNIAAGGSLTVRGPRPLVLAVYGDAVILGSINAGSIGGNVGAGRDPGLCADAGISLGTRAGGGGGGFGVSGGNGGNTGGLAGGQSGDLLLRPLRGGCSGNQGTPGTGGNVGQGGLGGGAIQVSAAGRLVIGAGVVVTASGQGGRGAIPQDNGAGGGGSGGALLLEGAVVFVHETAFLSANGGAGGEGGGMGGGGNGANGGDGAAASPAQATCGDNSQGASGGPGGALAGPAGNGGDEGTFGGGGGGGAVGRIRVYGATACRLDAGQSPQASYGGQCPQG